MFQYSQLIQLIGINKRPLRGNGEIIFRIRDHFLDKRRRELRLLHPNIGLRGSGCIGFNDLLRFRQGREKGAIGFWIVIMKFLRGIEQIKGSRSA